MPRRYLFVGPTLPDAARLAAGADITVLPPVAAGDLLRLNAAPGDVVGIVDGYFHQVGAVRHKEILTLLEQGVRVLGAASMGALRAAELDVFGMVGVGGVYADYRDGRLEADDEVTLLHGTAEEGYRPLSVPLVCIRATLAGAVAEGVCDAGAARRLIEVFARRPYHQRCYDALGVAGREAGLGPETVARVRRYCTAHPADPKRDDALLLIDALKDAGANADPVGTPRVHLTASLHAWRLAAEGRAIGADARDADLTVLRACQLLHDDYPRFHRELVFRHLAAECAADCGTATGGTPPEQRRAALRHGEHRGLYRLPADPDRLGFLDPWLTRAERDTLPPAERLAVFLVRGFRVAPGIPPDGIALRALRGHPVWARARQAVRLAWELNDRIAREHPGHDPDRLPRRGLLDLFARRYAAGPGELDLAAMDRGLESAAALAEAGRPFYMLARYNRDAVARLFHGAALPRGGGPEPGRTRGRRAAGRTAAGRTAAG